VALIHSLPSNFASSADAASITIGDTAAAPATSAATIEEATEVEVATTDVATLPEDDISLSTTNGDFPWLFGAGFAAVIAGIAAAIFVPLKHGGNKDPRLH
jgi:hypothetical protein